MFSLLMASIIEFIVFAQIHDSFANILKLLIVFFHICRLPVTGSDAVYKEPNAKCETESHNAAVYPHVRALKPKITLFVPRTVKLTLTAV